MSYILLNVLKRAIFEDVYKATNQVPFQTKDRVLLIIWAILGFVGLSLQLYASMGQPSFPTKRRSQTARPRRIRSRSSSSSSRSKRRRSKHRSRSRRTVSSRSLVNPIEESVSRRSGLVRASAPPTEHADETQPLLYEIQSASSPGRALKNVPLYEAV